MDDFVMYVDRRAVRFQRKLDDIHGAHYARAEPPRSYPQQYFSIRCSRHFCPKWLISEDSIIPHGAPCPHPVSQKFPFTYAFRFKMKEEAKSYRRLSVA